MRREATEAEDKLWRLLRDRRLAEFKFRQQVPIGRYIVDLMCPTAQLIIEVDGSQHADDLRDAVRDSWLAQQGYRALRLWNNDVLARPTHVLDAVRQALHQEHPQ